MKRFLTAAVLIVVSIASADAQRFGESVQVTIVEVPVTVVDRGGQPVRGLTKEAFEVYDEGKRVPIEYFEMVEMTVGRDEEPADAALPPAPVASRNFLLLFDLANSSPGTIHRAGGAAKQFVDDHLGPRDLVAVAVFTAESGAKMITNFTRNRTLLMNAIDTLGNPKWFRITDPLMISASVQGRPDGGNEAGEDARSGLDSALTERAMDQNRLAQTAHDNEMRARLTSQFRNFGAVARSLDKLKGQKQIILLSEGFDARLVQGREQLGSDRARADAESSITGQVWNVDNDQRFGSSSTARDLSDMGQLFRRSDVVLHAFDIKGLRSDVDASAGLRKSSNEALHLLAAPTGGTVFKNVNELGENFERMLRQQEVVYILGFAARSTGKPGRFHELKVKARAGRVSHRAGYYEVGAAVSDLERTLTLAEILMNDAPTRDFDLSVAATPLPGPGGKARIPVVIEIPGPRLLEGIGGKAATASLYLYAFDGRNEVVDFIQQQISVDLSMAGETVRASGVRYFGTLRVPAGRYTIKALVRVEESGRTGLARDDLQVPAFDTAVVLPPVLFVEPSNWVMIKAPSRGDDYPYPFSAGEASYIPRRAAALEAAVEQTIALFLYRMPLENLRVVPEVVTAGSNQAAKVRLLGRTSADERGGVKLLFRFKPEGLAAGKHELRFTVTAQDGTSSVVTMPFEIL